MTTSAHLRPSDSGTGTGHKNSFNVTNSYNTTYVDEEPKILQWLSSLEPRVRHQDVRTRRMDGVGEWFLQTEEFLNWRDGKDGDDAAVLFCSGAPGAGKTHLSSLVIDRLCDQVVGKNVAVACIYSDFQTQKEQTPENMLGALVKQIVRALGSIPSEINEAFQNAKGQVGGRGPLIPELVKFLKTSLARLDRAYICIDAVDECLAKHLPKLLGSLYALSQQCHGIRLFITGRPHVQTDIKKHFPGDPRFFNFVPKREDIIGYLEMMLDDDPELNAMSPELRAGIMKIASETISGVFLLVSLRIATILEETTLYKRQQQLKRVTDGFSLDGAYRATLERIENQTAGKAKLGKAALMWISHSEEPMKVDELCDALGVELKTADVTRDNIPSSQTLLASCLGLVTVDQEESTVRLVHFTLQEYFDCHSETFHNPYAKMAEVCLTYLNFDCVNKLPTALRYAPSTTPFLQHASCYWGVYARHETTDSVKSLALQLFHRIDRHISAKLLLFSDTNAWYLISQKAPKGFTGIHCVAYFGMDEILNCLLEKKDLDVEGFDCCGRTPLLWAANQGHGGILRILLERKNTNPDTKDAKYGRTLLSWAAGRGHSRVVKMLLERDEVNPESQDNEGRTPLSYGAKGGIEGVVKMLLERDEVNPESRDNEGRTPLSRAARSEGVVKMLLERNEVNPQSQDNKGRTPLSYAAENGSEGVVKMLLERDEVNPESQDNEGRTLLSRAAQWGTEGVVKMLLERDEVNPESRDIEGRTPLCYAAVEGMEGVVKILLERDEVNPESQDNEGRTPLSYAAEDGKEEVVKILLELDTVNPALPDNRAMTPLFWASQGEHVAIVELLQAHLATQTVAQVRNAPGPSLPNRNEEANPVVQLPSQSDVLNTRSSQHSIGTSSLPAVPASDLPAQTPDTLSHDLKSNTWIPPLKNPIPTPRTPFGIGGAFTHLSHTGPLPEFSAQAFLSSLAKK